MVYGMAWGQPIHGIEPMLNDAKIKAAKPADKDYKLGDSGQLYLHVTKAGGKFWRMNYTVRAHARAELRQKTLTFGSYPAVTLLDARSRRDEAKKLLSQGIDPSEQRKADAEANAIAKANTFEAVGRMLFEMNSGWSLEQLEAYRDANGGKWSWKSAHIWATSPGRWSAVHSADVLKSLENDAYPYLGDMPINEIKAPKVLEVLRRVERRGAIESAHRLRQRCSMIFVFGIGEGVCDTDPAAGIGANLKDVPKSKPQPSIVDKIRDLDAQVAAVRQMLVDCEAERCRAITKLALRFIALTAVRSNEVHGARWSEIEGLDGPEPTWIIPAERMKGDKGRKEEELGEHIVPLSRQAVEVLQVMRRLSGQTPLIFPSEKSLFQPISENTLRDLLIRAGYYKRHVPHGFRSAFSTIMNERTSLQWKAAGHKDAAPDRAIIDLMLAHVPKDKVEGVYNRAAYMPRRRELAQEWADLIFADFWPPEIHLGQPIRYAATGPGAYAVPVPKRPRGRPPKPR